MKKVSTAVTMRRLKRGRPTCTERNQSLPESANGSMATVATRREKNLLTRTGLLMEGVSTH
jgi:uncharacterized protein YifN (PemK superfamily)